MEVVVLVRRILFAPLFRTSGLGYLTRTLMIAAHGGSRGAPKPIAPAVVVGNGLLMPAALVLHGLRGVAEAQARMVRAWITDARPARRLTLTGPLLDLG